MVKKAGDGEILRCSFCNKDQNDVRKLIAGPTVFICDECVEVCNDIIADDNKFEARGGARSSSLPVPQDIKKFLEDTVARDKYYQHNDPDHSDCDRQNADWNHSRGVSVQIEMEGRPGPSRDDMTSGTQNHRETEKQRP